MTTPSGQIRFSEIATEFGNVTNKNIGAYRVSQSIAGRDWPLDDGIPTSGTIKFSDFKGKTCNVIVDYTVESTAVDSGSYYDSYGVVVGGFKSLPDRFDESKTKKVYHFIRTTLGATTLSNSNSTALKTGSWSNSTILLRYIVTSSGKIYGGAGRPNSGSGGHAFGLNRSCEIVVEDFGEIRSGGGAGGKGGDYSFGSFNYSCSASGGRGGSGRGYDNLTGSLAGSIGVGEPGGRCNGGDCRDCGSNSGGGAGGGGNGGNWGQNGCSGCNAGSTGPKRGFPHNESETRGDGSGGGSAGAAIIRSNSGYSAVITGNRIGISGSIDSVGEFV
jgi:hypothetical protein